MNHPPGMIKSIPGSSLPVSQAVNDLCLSIIILMNGAYFCPAVGLAMPENPIISNGSDLFINQMLFFLAVCELNMKILAPVSKRALMFLIPVSVLICIRHMSRL